MGLENTDVLRLPSGTYARVQPHGPLELVFGGGPAPADGSPPPDGLWVVHGTFPIAGILPFPRTMAVVRTGGRLVLINGLRLDGAGEGALKALGPITAVVRLGAYHGVDDDYYAREHGAAVFGLAGMSTPRGAGGAAPRWLVRPQAERVPSAAPAAALPVPAEVGCPIPGARVHVFRFVKPEAALLLPPLGGGGATLILCDALINVPEDPPLLGWLPRVVLRLGGWTGLRQEALWYGWQKSLGGLDDRGMRSEYDRLLAETQFEAVVFGHGAVIREGGHAALSAAIDKHMPYA